MAQINLGHVVGQGVPSGGTAGQILKKNGSTNFDTSWATLDGSMVPVSASDSTTVQQSLAAVKSDMGIVEDGNTATHTIAAGQYVIWKGALYTASAAIPAGTTLSTSNLTAVSGGGLNSLNGKIENKFTKSVNSLSDLNTVISELESGERITVLLSGNVADALIDHSAVSTAIMTKMDGSTADMMIFSLGGYYVGAIRYNTSSGVTRNLELALKSDITSNSDVKSQLSPASNITLSTVLKQEIGALVIVYISITTSASISANTDILSGLPTPIGTQNYVVTFLAHTATSETDTYRMSVIDGGKVKNLDALPNGKVIRATFMYFKA